MLRPRPTTLRRATLIGIAALLASAPLARAQRPERVEISNRLDVSVLVWVNGDPRVFVPAGETESTGDLPEGTLNLLASDAATGRLLATERTALAPGEVFTWTLFPVAVVGEEAGTGIVVLMNGLDTSIQVALGGNEVALLAPGATRVLPRVVAGTVNATARDLSETVVAETTLTIPDGEITRWIVGR